MPTNQVSFEFWPVTNEDDMFARLKALKAAGYRGQLRLTPEGLWDMEVNAPDDHSSPVTVHVGDVLVMIGGVLQAMSTEVYESRFGA